MSHNPYAAPAAVLLDPDPTPDLATETLFYVVAKTKFLLLMIGTLGVYVVYWFYRNWRQLNRRDKAYWPIPRAIFSVFFVYSLFQKIDDLRSMRGVDFRWSPGWMATIFIACTVLDWLCPWLSSEGLISEATEMSTLLLLIPTTWAMAMAQTAINVTEGDPHGITNARITPANIAWLLIGALLWLMMLSLTYSILTGQLVS